ncbi:MAG: hypothetical protein ACPLXP_00400 [Microgenomates group bacterium]
MKKLSIYLLLFAFYLLLASPALAACNPPQDYSGCPITRMGPKIAANTGLADICLQQFQEPPNYLTIRSQYNPLFASQQIPVNVIYTTEDLSADHLDELKRNLHALRQNGLFPIIRISSSTIGSDGWGRISSEEAREAAQTLNLALREVGFSQPPVVYFGNEVNLPPEWGGEVNIQNYSQVFGEFIRAAGGQRRFQIFLPPMATHRPDDIHSAEQILNYLESQGLKVDGAAVNVYEENLQKMIGEYERQASFYRKMGISNLIIPEIGPWKDGRLLQNPEDKEKWKEIMAPVFQALLQDPSLFGGARFITTSFFQDEDGDGDPDITLLVVIGPNGEVKIIPLILCGGYLFEPYKNGLPITTNFLLRYEEAGELSETIQTTKPEGEKVQTENPRKIRTKLILDQADVPNFSETERTYQEALKRLLPAKIQEKTYLPQNSFKSWYRHYVYGSRNEEPEEIPETQKVIPEWWTRLIGEASILNFLKPGNLITNFKPFYPQPHYLAVKGTLNPQIADQKGKSTASVDPKELFVFNNKEYFHTPSLFQSITDILYEAIDLSKNLYRKITRSANSTTLTVKSRGNLIEGKTFIREVDFLDVFLARKLSSPKNYSLSSSSHYSFPEHPQNFFPQEGSEKINIKDLGKSQRKICLHLASILPAKINISEVNPLCSSRKLDDYLPKLEKEAFKNLANAYCIPGPTGCDFYQPGGSPSCEGDPVCEGGKCYPLMWRQAKDYLGSNCPLPYQAQDCNEVCAPVTFEPAEDGRGWGPCHYQNPTVCVRQDFQEVGDCAALCNWACCAY